MISGIERIRSNSGLISLLSSVSVVLRLYLLHLWHRLSHHETLIHHRGEKREGRAILPAHLPGASRTCSLEVSTNNTKGTCKDPLRPDVDLCHWSRSGRRQDS